MFQSPKKRALKVNPKKIKSKEIVEENAMTEDDSDREKSKDARDKEAGAAGGDSQKKKRERTKDSTAKSTKDEAKKSKKEEKRKVRVGAFPSRLLYKVPLLFFKYQAYGALDIVQYTMQY